MTLPAIRPGRFQVLVYHRAEGYVHDSIPAAVEAIRALGTQHGFGVDATDEPDAFTDATLAGYATVVFVHTSGDMLPAPSQRDALERYVRGGGGWFGIHGAACMGEELAKEWPFYRDLVGARFIGHNDAHVYTDEDLSAFPDVVVAGPLADAPDDAVHHADNRRASSCVPATIHVEEVDSPAIRGFHEDMRRVDEWYGFDENPRHRVHVLATVDETTYEPGAGAMGDDHPIAWTHRVGDGQAIYNSMGHAASTWHDRAFLQSVLGGIEMAARTVASELDT